MKNTHDRRAAKIGTAALSFGGWGDYEVWAAHGFTPKPKSDPTHPQAETPEGGGVGGDGAGGGGAAARGKGARKRKAGGAAGKPTGPDSAGHTDRGARADPGRDPRGSRRGKAEPATGQATRRGETAGPDHPGQGAVALSPNGIDPAEPTPGTGRHEAVRPQRPGRPTDQADDRTRGRRAASLGTRPAEPGSEPLDVPEPPRPRPYVRGTTPPPPRARHVLPPEVMLFATGRHRGAGPLDPDLAALCRMCQIPTSIAEVSVYLTRSLDDTRVLVRHGIDRGLLVAEVAELGLAGRPPLALLHRVHQGLLRL